jgi:carboxypeptidase T
LIIVAIASAIILLPGPATLFDEDKEGTSWLVDSALGAGPPPDYPYRDLSTVVQTLYDAELEYPEIVSVLDIGDSWEKTEDIADRDILAMKISDNVDLDEDEPEVLIMALHHAREWPTTEIALQLIETLTDLYGIDSRISWLVDNREIWIVPVVNPDGFEYSMAFDDMWRKNRRDNGDGTYGVDLNRNYAGSENGDPLGEWGGAGASHVTSDSTYCGEYAFSEPETQAIRDLAKSHAFSVAIDFHTYGNFVMWPWGYTTDEPPDNEDLVRIGNDMAALNGYEADQSVGLYPTTGDSLDWLYGSEDVFTFLFEVGDGPDFNPDSESTVLEQIEENIPPALHLIEIAGDRQEMQFDIVHTPLGDTLYSDAGFELDADITAARGVDVSSLTISYCVDGGDWNDIDMTKSSGDDTYSGQIPPVAGGSSISYYILAKDDGGVTLTSPQYAPYDVHSFAVLPDTEAPTADAGLGGTISLGTAFTFDGSDSSDNVGITNFTWAFVYNGTTVELYGESPTFTFWTEGTYAVTLLVTDGSGNHDSDMITVVVINGAIPEFGDVLIPVVLILAVFLFVRTRRGRNGSPGDQVSDVPSREERP